MNDYDKEKFKILLDDNVKNDILMNKELKEIL